MRQWGWGGIPETPVYEDMHANNDIRGKKKKLTSMRRPKSREQPEI